MENKSLTKLYAFKDVLQVTKLLFLQADTTTVRAILALSSLLFAVGLVLPGADLNRPGFRVMVALAPQGVWAAMFFAHFVGQSWRFLDPEPRILWSLYVNGFGFLLWFVSTISISWSYRAFAPGTSAELVLCLFSAWALLRTGSRAEILTP